jgi:hypothetical protein
MNFIEAANKFYEGFYMDKTVFITRKGWGRTRKTAEDAYFWSLCMKGGRNFYLAIAKINKDRKPVEWIYLSQDDYNANDWAVFDADTWKIREDTNANGN